MFRLASIWFPWLAAPVTSISSSDSSSMSVKMPPSSAPSPSLTTVIVHSTTSPRVAVIGSTALVIVRSGVGITPIVIKVGEGSFSPTTPSSLRTSSPPKDVCAWFGIAVPSTRP